MKRVSSTILLALLLLIVLVATVYSQQGSTADTPVVRVLQGGIHQEIPVNITLQISTETGVQTVTVPLKLDLNLNIGPVDAVDLDVSLEPATQFVSPITLVGAVEPTATITATEEMTATESE